MKMFDSFDSLIVFAIDRILLRRCCRTAGQIPVLACNVRVHN